MTGLQTRPTGQVDYDDFCPMLVSHTSSQEESTSPFAYMQESMNLVFANQDDEQTIYPLTTSEIAEAQKHNRALNTIADKYGNTTQLVENINVLCKDGKMVIPTSLQSRAEE
jgi:hypothetical protein